MRKLFYIYDSVADNFIYFCEAPTDSVAIRSFKYSCQSDFKAVASDLSLFCFGTVSNDGIIPDKVKICDSEVFL